MSLQVIKLLKNLNGSVLFFFLILFTAPLGADDVISGNLGDERRRTNAGPVAIKLVSYNDLSAVQLNTSNETAHQDLISHPDSAIELSSQDNNYSDVASADLKLQQAFWCHQCSVAVMLLLKARAKFKPGAHNGLAPSFRKPARRHTRIPRLHTLPGMITTVAFPRSQK